MKTSDEIREKKIMKANYFKLQQDLSKKNTIIESLLKGKLSNYAPHLLEVQRALDRENGKEFTASEVRPNIYSDVYRYVCHVFVFYFVCMCREENVCNLSKLLA